MKYSKNIVGKIHNKDIVAYNIKFNNGFEVEILNLGGIITKIMTPDKNNKSIHFYWMEKKIYT
ncbi:MAG: hypothetical protein ACRDD7_15535 [Peptostreptococcaceae bacterium]